MVAQRGEVAATVHADGLSLIRAATSVSFVKRFAENLREIAGRTPLHISEETGDQVSPVGKGGFVRRITKSPIPEAIAGNHTREDVCRNAVHFAALDRGGLQFELG